MSATKRVPAALIAAVHGIRGEVKLRSYTEQPIESYNPLYFESGEAVNIKVTGRKDVLFIIQIPGIDDRNEAEKLKGKLLYLDAAKLPPSTEEQPYEYEILNLEVRDETGANIGRITEVADYGAGTVVEITYADGTPEMFPFNRKFFPTRNLSEGFLVFNKPETLT